MLDVLRQPGSAGELDGGALRQFVEGFHGEGSHVERQVLFKTYTLARFHEITQAS
jgi:hypothetical protein